MSATVLINQAPTNLGPLTTTFTPPPGCTVAVGAGKGFLGGVFGGAKDQDVAWLGQACSRGKATDATSCWPATSKGAESREAPLHGWGYYSPGLHCPIGYATACSATGGSGGGSDWPVQFKLLAGETAVGCCPSGYGCANINGQTCTIVATSTTIPTVTCDGSKSGGLTFMTIPDDSVTAFSMFAPMIQINWQSSDRPKSSSPTATRTSIPLESASGTKVIDTENEPTEETLVLDGDGDDDSDTQPTGAITGTLLNPDGSLFAAPTSSLNNSTDVEDQPGLGSSVKVGLGVAGAVVVVMAFVVVLFWCWRRKKSKLEDQELDRLYGIRHAATGSMTDLAANKNEIPGWYRGERLATPTKDPQFRESLREMRMPAEPVYQQPPQVSPYQQQGNYGYRM
ncbi:hypothetical protein QBC35DRAFT_140095 [Podospora australis]|uniref:Uncharacterized protein n=1 Tax=Podospora australis TaxID=1536484 RepID=A0AAN6WJM5_9PEZI|nr:hypothetical protein QBC35DRAFT_140095 [Podospora australis]